jgi:DNA-binding HxlR family transcriptional regulator
VERAGSRALSIFTHALSARVLRAHAARPLRRGELEEKLGWAPQSSLRAAVGGLRELGALAHAGPGKGSPSPPLELSGAGRELLAVEEALARWLAQGPEGLVALDDAAGRGILGALLTAWDSTVAEALAERPLTLTDLNAVIGDLSYRR